MNTEKIPNIQIHHTNDTFSKQVLKPIEVYRLATRLTSKENISLRANLLSIDTSNMVKFKRSLSNALRKDRHLMPKAAEIYTFITGKEIKLN